MSLESTKIMFMGTVYKNRAGKTWIYVPKRVGAVLEKSYYDVVLKDPDDNNIVTSFISKIYFDGHAYYVYVPKSVSPVLAKKKYFVLLEKMRNI